MPRARRAQHVALGVLFTAKSDAVHTGLGTDGSPDTGRWVTAMTASGPRPHVVMMHGRTVAPKTLL